MEVTINKKREVVPPGTKVSDLIKERGYRKASVWINGDQLLKAEMHKRIEPGDDIKILRIVGGG